MNKNLIKIIALNLLMCLTHSASGMLNKVSLQEVYAQAKLSQEKFNKFWFNLYDFERERISDLIKIQTKSIEKKSTALATPNNTMVSKKIKKGLLYCLPTIASGSISALGLYFFNKSLYDDTANLQSLVYSSLATLSAAYCTKLTLPFLKIGLYSLYKSITYNKYLESKRIENEDVNKKIENASTD